MSKLPHFRIAVDFQAIYSNLPIIIELEAADKEHARELLILCIFPNGGITIKSIRKVGGK